MFAKLGDITFEILTAFENIGSDRSIELAEHKVLMSKPTLQNLGVGLENITLPFSFDIAFCDVKQEVKKLEDAHIKAEPMQLVFANGSIYGSFIIESISKQIKRADAYGNFLTVSCDVTLREHFEEPEQKKERIIETKKEEVKKKTETTVIKRKQGKIKPKVTVNYKKEPLKKIVRKK